MKKFRAWGKHQNRMYYPQELSADGMTLDMNGRGLVNISGISNKLNQYDDNRNFVVEEDTGHLNWCQNDIIRTDHFLDAEEGQQYLYHQIVWSEKYLSWYAMNTCNEPFNELDSGTLQLWVFIKNAVNPEIAGNIHEVKK